jgi:hypothetical protein
MRALVQQMEKDLNTRLEWVAIDHYNTAHPHVHVLVRGRDATGNTLVMARAYLRESIRTRSQELATNALGYRLAHDMLAAREQAIDRVQLTELDRALLRRADGDRLVSFADPIPRDADRQERRLQEIRRLQFLTTVGLAEKVGSKTWQLAENVEQELRERQVQTDIIKTRARHQQHLRNPTAPVTITTLEPGMSVHGTLVGTGLAEELSDRRYLLLETPDGQLHYLIQPASVQRARGNGTLHIGDLITLAGKTFHTNGRAISYVELRMDNERARSFPTLEMLRAREAKPLAMEDPRVGAQYRGRLHTYASGPDGAPYAVLDTGKELRALRTEQQDLTIGHDIRAHGRELIDEENRRTRTLVWRLEDMEQERARHRDLGRAH